ncbi:polysaccharide biosynthesis tyrosine autokinase [Bifidobacterium olomucense]|uniref:non-specific protein-tyrosine kinase n=1 Tax=Bifidobacterium olomucense TaxID=2675324 RepID=A0A7Y0HWJ1_9BIFI|nr:polysaccharide biosynthesis tyrosine autokinase [Bifidobacterium sp. DSM 109959]NMM97698.1 protein-tyrosine kinase [Bifidobacterium sp. DSM 109959]
MSIQDIISTLRRRWRFELVVLIAAAAVIAVYLYVQVPVYSATTRVYISFSGEGAAADGPVDDTGASEPATSGVIGDSSFQYTPSEYVNQQLSLIPALVTTPAVLDGAADQLGLPSSQGLEKSLSAAVSDGYFVTITATDEQAQHAADIANAAASSLASQLASPNRSDTNLYIPSHLRLSIVNKAEAEKTPSSPNTKAIIGVGGLAACALACFAGIVRELCDNRIRRASEVQRLLHAPLLGTVPKSSSFQPGVPVIIRSSDTLEAEMIRRIASNLTFVVPDRTELSNVFVIASYGPGEGKTTLSIELAAAFAEQGRRVLLIGADFRHPSIAQRLGLADEVGLSHLLTGQVDMRSAARQYWKPGFHVLPAGRRVANPGILINSQSMRTLLHEVSRQYEWVIVDAEPMTVANDAAVFAKEGAKLVLVAGRGLSDRSQLRDMDREFEIINVQPVGVIWNFADQDRGAVKTHDKYYGGTKRRSGNEREAHPEIGPIPETRNGPTVAPADQLAAGALTGRP